MPQWSTSLVYTPRVWLSHQHITFPLRFLPPQQHSWPGQCKWHRLGLRYFIFFDSFFWTNEYSIRFQVLPLDIQYESATQPTSTTQSTPMSDNNNEGPSNIQVGYIHPLHPCWHQTTTTTTSADVPDDNWGLGLADVSRYFFLHSFFLTNKFIITVV